MFTDARSKRVIFVAHCLLNQNSISDGTADYPGANEEILQILLKAKVGIVQMPCPELCCLGLDRGNVLGAESPVVVENTRIRKAMQEPSVSAQLSVLTELVMRQIFEYHKHGFEVIGIVGINRSPCCGVNTTSDDNRELEGQGVFITKLKAALTDINLEIPVIGVKADADAAMRVEALL